nr:hypothetical protein Iba_chr10bCG2780 [Ipomoea batatas]GMD46433.1 hypothetical protein Iba_chr10eCG3230 [Ipomoea batatas]
MEISFTHSRELHKYPLAGTLFLKKANIFEKQSHNFLNMVCNDIHQINIYFKERE